MCQCGKSQPHFAEPGQPSSAAIWCAKCPQKTATAVDVVSRRCQCGAKRPTFGLPGQKLGQALWCKTCPGRDPASVCLGYTYVPASERKNKLVDKEEAAPRRGGSRAASRPSSKAARQDGAANQPENLLLQDEPRQTRARRSASEATAADKQAQGAAAAKGTKTNAPGAGKQGPAKQAEGTTKGGAPGTGKATAVSRSASKRGVPVEPAPGLNSSPRPTKRLRPKAAQQPHVA